MVSPAFGTCDATALGRLALQESGGTARPFPGGPHPATPPPRPPASHCHSGPGCPCCYRYSKQRSFRARFAQTYAIKNTAEEKDREETPEGKPVKPGWLQPRLMVTPFGLLAQIRDGRFLGVIEARGVAGPCARGFYFGSFQLPCLGFIMSMYSF